MITEAMINNYIAKAKKELKQELIDELGKKFTEVTGELESRIAELEEQANIKPTEEEIEETSNKEDSFWD